MKNIIFPIEFNHTTGGMIHSVISLIRGLSKDYKIYLLIHSDADIGRLDLNVEYLYLSNPWSISIKNPVKTIQTYFEVKRIMEPFDSRNTIVFTNNVGSELIFSGFGYFPLRLKRIFVSRGGDYTGKTGFFVKKGFSSVEHFIPVSKRQLNILRNVGISEKRISFIPNGLTVDGLESFQFQFGSNDKINLAILGYLNPLKNQALAIFAMKTLVNKISNIQLNLYGNDTTDGEYTKQLEYLIKKFDLGRHVQLLGYEGDKKKIFRKTDVLISTSLSEGFGRTVVEAMSLGIPCIGLYESGGLLDIIDNGINGLLINNDPQQLADALCLIYQDNELRDHISLNAKTKYKEKFTTDKMIEAYGNLLREKF